MKTRNLDMDVLRSLVAFTDHGTLAQAGDRVGRTQAALSLQMRRLEEQVGETLFSRDGRRLEFTEALSESPYAVEIEALAGATTMASASRLRLMWAMLLPSRASHCEV